MKKIKNLADMTDMQLANQIEESKGMPQPMLQEMARRLRRSAHVKVCTKTMRVWTYDPQGDLPRQRIRSVIWASD